MLGEMIRARKARRRRAGLTLVELLVSMAILALLVALAVPSMYEFIMRKRVEGTADELLADIRFARAVVAKDNYVAVLKFSEKKSGELCYTVYHPTGLLTCDCAKTPVCMSSPSTAAQELKTVRFPASGKLSVKPAAGSGRILQFEAPMGIPPNGNTVEISISASSGGEVRLITSPTGRAMICSVTGHTNAYPACESSSPSP